MDGSATAALTVSIVAVVLGGIGLIGGVIGYVQGTAALHRATSARQRATGAEEAALQARAAAEATTRSAEELLERLQRRGAADAVTGSVPAGGPSTGPVPSLSTGPVGIGPVSSRLAPPAGAPSGRLTVTSGGEAPSVGAGPAGSQPRSDPGSRGAAPAPAEQQDGAAFEIPVSGSRPPDRSPTGSAPSPTVPGAPGSAPPTRSRPPEATAVPASGPFATVRTAGMIRPAGPASGAESVDGGRPAEQQPAEAFAFPVSIPTGPPADGGVPEAVESSSRTVDEQEQGQDQEPAPEFAQEPTPAPEPEPQPEPQPQVAVLQRAQVVLEPTAPAPQEGTPLGADDAVQPAAEPDADPAGPERGSRGQVVVGSQDAPPMDWAEVLRTGAIPLPSIARGTYAAPRRASKPTGRGPARFELRLSGRQRYQAVNVGGEPAEEARVEGAGDDPHLVRPLSSRPATVPPGGALAFSVLRVEGRDAAAQVLWTRDGAPLTQHLPLD